MMINMMGRKGLGEWLFRGGVLLAWCRTRPPTRKALLLVSDRWLRALDHKNK